jgi:5'-phosphate synthase pdxT subunit
MNHEGTVGVLALQGASEPHRATLRRLGVEAREVRAARDLAGLSHLVLPGGESTTLHQLLTLFGLWEPLQARHREGSLALFGTCAGAILLGRHSGTRPPSLQLLDAELERNAYGRQRDSSVRPLTLAAELGRDSLEGVFIRAPRFLSLGPGLRILARDGAEPVAVEGPGCLATSFHPELALEPCFHARFLSLAPAGAREASLSAER